MWKRALGSIAGDISSFEYFLQCLLPPFSQSLCHFSLNKLVPQVSQILQGYWIPSGSTVNICVSCLNKIMASHYAVTFALVTTVANLYTIFLILKISLSLPTLNAAVTFLCFDAPSPLLQDHFRVWYVRLMAVFALTASHGLAVRCMQPLVYQYQTLTLFLNGAQLHVHRTISLYGRLSPSHMDAELDAMLP